MLKTAENIISFLSTVLEKFTIFTFTLTGEGIYNFAFASHNPMIILR